VRIEIEVPDSAPLGQHGVYVLLDAQGDPLYIGRSQSLHRRLIMHRQTQPWWPQVRALEWTPCVDAVDARRVERQMIETFCPSGNRNDRIPTEPGRAVLPDEIAAELRTLRAAAAAARFGDSDENIRFGALVVALRRAGWALASIGHPLGVTPEFIRQVQAAFEARPRITALPDVPARPPLRRPKPLGKRALMPNVSPETAARLVTLHSLARWVNGGTPVGHPSREASEELTELLAAEVIRGVSVAELARVLGVRHYAIRARLARHGYANSAPSAVNERYLNRQVGGGSPQPTCKRGHEMAGDNLRITKPGGVRVCRACERIRSAAHAARQSA